MTSNYINKEANKYYTLVQIVRNLHRILVDTYMYMPEITKQFKWNETQIKFQKRKTWSKVIQWHSVHKNTFFFLNYERYFYTLCMSFSHHSELPFALISLLNRANIKGMHIPIIWRPLGWNETVSNLKLVGHIQTFDIYKWTGSGFPKSSTIKLIEPVVTL